MEFKWLKEETNITIAQAPKGNGGERIYEHFSIELKTVKNIRAGK